MIVAGQSQSQKPKASPIGSRPGRPSYIPAAYETAKIIIKSYGYYEQVEPYLPDKYVDKYTYKPHKRVSGYLGQTIHKPKNAVAHRQFGKTRSGFHRGLDKCQRHFSDSQGCYGSK